MEQVILALFSGAAITLLTTIVAKSTADKKNAIENITQERKKWRDDLRGATVALRRYFENKDRPFYREKPVKKPFGKIVFHSAAEAKAFFEVRLNLGDPEDCKLMAILDRLVTHDCSSRKPTFQKWEAVCKKNGFETEKMLEEDLLAHFEEGMSHNLKCDWERAKNESSAKIHFFEIGRCLTLVGFVYSTRYIFLNEAYFQMSSKSMQSVNFSKTFFTLCLLLLFVVVIEKGLSKMFNKFRREGQIIKAREFINYCPCAVFITLALILFIILQATASSSIAFVVIYLAFKIMDELCTNPIRTRLLSNKQN
ncbi:hypothetical protein [Hallerella succinigenes]|uniref:hypothetical protein n=1 Tax=Hallerella succinigenes TaxID=1896222 RepID=UPI002A7F199B|nr:hypothetical protein [Hallerella succinigenes]MDY5030201.1 hypothetical protein [Hallerella succinigenes]